MNLTRTDAASTEKTERELVEWAQAFKADSGEQVREIPNFGINEAVRTMELIMENPMVRDLICARLDAEIDCKCQVFFYIVGVRTFS